MEFGTIIRNGTVVDGTGASSRHAEVGIIDYRITAIDKHDGATEAHVIDASRRVVSPGFIDVHIHSEVALAIRRIAAVTKACFRGSQPTGRLRLGSTEA